MDLKKIMFDVFIAGNNNSQQPEERSEIISIAFEQWYLDEGIFYQAKKLS